MFEITLPLGWDGGRGGRGGTVTVVSLLPPTYSKQAQAGTRIVIIVNYQASYS